MSAFSSTKTLISQFAKSHGFDMKFLEARIQREWAQIVGASLASHTRPDSIKFRKLFLSAENSAWLQQLVFLKPTLLEKLHTFTEKPLITDIILRLGDIKPTSPNSSPINRPTTYSVEPSPVALELANLWTAEIQEPKLRSFLLTVIAKGISLNEGTSGSYPYR